MPLPHRASISAPPLLVHATHRPPAPKLGYIDQMVEAPGVHFRFSQRAIKRFDIDVVHVADERLDTLLGTRDRSDHRRLLATLAFIWAMRLRRVALVRTVLPPIARPTSRTGCRAQRLLDAATDVFVVLDETAQTPDPARTVVIPHAHFRDRFVGYPRSEQESGRVVWMLPTGSDDGDRRAATSLSSRVEPLETADLSDGALVREIAAAELVVVPRTEALNDLQVLFLALSLDRAVITPRTASMVSLAKSVGPGWLTLTDAIPTAEAIDTAVRKLRGVQRRARPHLDEHDPLAVRTAYGDAYKRAARSRRNGSPDDNRQARDT